MQCQRDLKSNTSFISPASICASSIRVTVETTEPGALPRWDHKARRVKDERTEVPF